MKKEDGSVSPDEKTDMGAEQGSAESDSEKKNKLAYKKGYDLGFIIGMDDPKKWDEKTKRTAEFRGDRFVQEDAHAKFNALKSNLRFDQPHDTSEEIAQQLIKLDEGFYAGIQEGKERASM